VGRPNKSHIELCISLSDISGSTLRICSNGPNDGLLMSIERDGTPYGEGVEIRLMKRQSLAVLNFLRQALGDEIAEQQPTEGMM